jgi:hypothetical protein
VESRANAYSSRAALTAAVNGRPHCESVDDAKLLGVGKIVGWHPLMTGILAPVTGSSR